MPYKQILLSECDLKFAKGSEGTFEGYLSIFDNVDSYGDVVRKGAYEETLSNWASKNQLPPMLLNHDAWSELPIGIWKSMEEDDTGLRVSGELTPGNPVSEKVFAAMKHRAVTGLSIGYRKAQFEQNDHGGYDLLKINLREGSVVGAPANDEARVDKVKLEDQDPLESWSDVEWFLRDAGFSKSAAKVLISQVKDFSQRDVAELQDEIEQLKSKLTGIEAAEKRARRITNLRTHIS